MFNHFVSSVLFCKLGGSRIEGSGYLHKGIWDTTPGQISVRIYGVGGVMGVNPEIVDMLFYTEMTTKLKKYYYFNIFHINTSLFGFPDMVQKGVIDPPLDPPLGLCCISTSQTSMLEVGDISCSDVMSELCCGQQKFVNYI